MCRHLSLQGLRDERGGSLSREICVSLDLTQVCSGGTNSGAERSVTRNKFEDPRHLEIG